MFTGIIETIGLVKGIEQQGSNKKFNIETVLLPELKVDQSVAHNGVCLTIMNIGKEGYSVVAVDETLKKSNLGMVNQGDKINLERCMLNNGRFDGHIVQGHVDQVGVVTNVQELEGSWLYDFEYDPAAGNITVEKGSITVNGVSLTCFNSSENSFRVTIIPYTHQFTNFHMLKKGDIVNLEFDVIGKYVKRLLNLS